MTQRYMLDTNTVSYLMKGMSPAARAAIGNLTIDQVPCISSITEGELRYGLAKRAGSPSLTALLEQLLLRVDVLPWRWNEARVYGALRAKQERTGKSIGPLDTLIAAHAISVDAILVSNDKGFRNIPDLPGLTSWATDL